MTEPLRLGVAGLGTVGRAVLKLLDQNGRLGHDGGVTPWPGLYVTGLPVLRRRRSTFIDGAAADAADITGHLVAYLDDRARTLLPPRNRTAV